MKGAAKLPFMFDVARLQADLAQVEQEPWANHINKRIYQGEWSALPLRAIKDFALPTVAFHSPEDEYEDHPLLERCPYYREVLESFKTDLKVARLLKLTPGSKIDPHTDMDLAFEDGLARIHVVVATNSGVTFTHASGEYHMEAGECWWADFDKSHGFVNDGATDRVHLVIDMVINPWLAEIIEQAAKE